MKYWICALKRMHGYLAVVFLLSGSVATTQPGAGKPVLTTVMDAPMPGSAVRFDYQSLDVEHGRLYISHMNANQLVDLSRPEGAAFPTQSCVYTLTRESRTGQEGAETWSRATKDHSGRSRSVLRRAMAGPSQITGRSEQCLTLKRCRPVRSGPIELKPALNLRKWQRLGDQIGDVRDDLVECIARLGGKLLPARIVEEPFPSGLKLLHSGKGEHVGETWCLSARQDVSEEYGVEPDILEDLESAAMKHFHLSYVFGITRALIGSQLENPSRSGGG